MRPVSGYQKAAKILVIILTFTAVLSCLCMLADYVISCRGSAALYADNIFQTISEWTWALGFLFFKLLYASLSIGVDTYEEYQEVSTLGFTVTIGFLILFMLLISSLFYIQSRFTKKGARTFLGVTLGVTIYDLVGRMGFLVVGIKEVTSQILHYGSFEMMMERKFSVLIFPLSCIVGTVLEIALIFCLVKSLKFTWKNYEYY